MDDKAMKNYANTFCEDVTTRDDCNDCKWCLQLGEGCYCEKKLFKMCGEYKKEEDCLRLNIYLKEFAAQYGGKFLERELEKFRGTDLWFYWH